MREKFTSKIVYFLWFQPYKYSTCIARWNDVETVVSNARGVFVGS